MPLTLRSRTFVHLESRFSWPFSEIVRHHTPVTAKRILDVGCGSGTYLSAVARKDRELWGVDIDPGQVAEASKWLSRFPGQKRLLSEDFLEVKLPMSYFDCAASTFSMHDFFTTATVDKLHGVLRRGGSLLVLDLDRRYEPVTRERRSWARSFIRSKAFGRFELSRRDPQELERWIEVCVALYSTSQMQAHLRRPTAKVLYKAAYLAAWSRRFEVRVVLDVWPGVYFLHLRRR